jgi:hypothetical protein
MAIGKPRGKKGMRPVFVYHGAACDSDVLHTAQQSQRIPLYVATGPRRWAAAWVAGLGSGYPHHREAR